jgi:dephospho-CoA kinase
MPGIIGLTGNIACGKTAVGQMLLKLGAERYIDADAIVHRLYESGEPVAVQIARVFGAGVMAADGSVNRQALGAIVFQDATALQCLEQIVHPAVGLAMIEELASVSPSGIAVIDAVKLLESGSGALCQSKWLVVCSQEQQLTRLLVRNHLSQEEAHTRIHTQTSVAAKFALVDEIVDNSGSLEETRIQVAAAYERFYRKYSI